MKKKRKGFSLIEVLVVIGIIGILASVVLVSLSAAREKAKRASALASAKSIMAEIQTCFDDEGDVSAYNSLDDICNIVGHTAKWPDISDTGWTINANAQSPLDETYTYSITRGSEMITCSLSSGACV